MSSNCRRARGNNRSHRTRQASYQQHLQLSGYIFEWIKHIGAGEVRDADRLATCLSDDRPRRRDDVVTVLDPWEVGLWD